MLNTDLTDLEVVGNYIEAAFWISIGLAFLVRGRKRLAPFFSLPLIAGTVFVLFGASDVVEAQNWRLVAAVVAPGMERSLPRRSGLVLLAL